jgi:hypothetical protein
MTQELLKNIFIEPFNREQWLKDQQTLIDRLGQEQSEFYKEQKKVMERFQKANQCSIVMIEIIRERLAAYETQKTLDKQE